MDNYYLFLNGMRLQMSHSIMQIHATRKVSRTKVRFNRYPVAQPQAAWLMSKRHVKGKLPSASMFFSARQLRQKP